MLATKIRRTFLEIIDRLVTRLPIGICTLNYESLVALLERKSRTELDLFHSAKVKFGRIKKPRERDKKSKSSFSALLLETMHSNRYSIA